MRFSCGAIAVVSTALVLAGSRANSLIRWHPGAGDTTGTRESQAGGWWVTAQTLEPFSEIRAARAPVLLSARKKIPAFSQRLRSDLTLSLCYLEATCRIPPAKVGLIVNSFVSMAFKSWLSLKRGDSHELWIWDWTCRVLFDRADGLRCREQRARRGWHARSGSQIFFVGDNNSRVVAAVHVYGGDQGNSGIRVNEEVFDLLSGWLR